MRLLRGITAVGLGMAFLLAAPTAASGGGSWLELDDPYVVPGEMVTSSGRFSARGSGTGRLWEGPWYAYLLAQDRYLRPGPIPPAAMPLGQLTVERLDRFLARASITFTVPDVPPGDYSISICNDPCTKTGVGDLIGGWMSVAQSEEDALLRRMRDEVDQELRRMRWRLGHRLREVQRPLEGLGDRVERLESSIERRFQALEARLRRTEQPRSEAPNAVALGGWAVAAVFLAAAEVFRRRRRRRPPSTAARPASSKVEWIVPDEPDELVGTTRGPTT